MFSTALALRQICLEYLTENANFISKSNGNNHFVINGNLAEHLLESLSVNNKLTDEVLFMSIFDSKTTQLKNIRIPNASQLSTIGLKALKAHRINQLEVCGLANCTLDELISCLSEWSLMSLRYLNISHSLFVNSNEYYNVAGLTKLQNLKVLDVSHTQLNNEGLEIVVKRLQCLQSLNISATRVRDITPLVQCKDRLKFLSMYNLKPASGDCEQFVPVLTELNLLTYLDISDDRNSLFDALTQLQDGITKILENPQCFKYLKSLDLSGRSGINREQLKEFIIYKQQSSCEPLKFLGLMNTIVCFEDLFGNDCNEWCDSELVVTGNATESQIMESLRRYKHRQTFVQESLSNLYDFILTYCEPRAQLIDLITIPMKEHLKESGIQIAAIACLIYLTKKELCEKIHPSKLKQVVDVTLNAMELFPNDQRLQINALRALNSYHILQNVSFDRLRCCKLLLESLVNFRETLMDLMALSVFSLLAFKIPYSKTSNLCTKPVYMETLLAIVTNRVQLCINSDMRLKLTLNTLWSLTDESPKTCEMFLKNGGIELSLAILDKLGGHSDVVQHVLYLLNTVAKVTYLKSSLMKSKVLTACRCLMNSSPVDVSFFAAEIFANLCCDGIDCWSCSSIDFKSILDELMNVVLNWKIPEKQICAFRSFRPRLHLLNCFELPAVQLYAIWAVHYVYSENPKRYREMVTEENVAQAIKAIYETSKNKSNESFILLCEQTLDIFKKEFPNFVY